MLRYVLTYLLGGR